MTAHVRAFVGLKLFSACVLLDMQRGVWAASELWEMDPMHKSLPSNWHLAQGHSVLDGGEFTSLHAHHAMSAC